MKRLTLLVPLFIGLLGCEAGPVASSPADGLIGTGSRKEVPDGTVGRTGLDTATLEVHLPGAAELVALGEVTTSDDMLRHRGLYPRLTLTRAAEWPGEPWQMSLEETARGLANDRWLVQGLSPGRYKLTLDWCYQIALGGGSGFSSALAEVRSLDLNRGSNVVRMPMPRCSPVILEGPPADEFVTIRALPLPLGPERPFHVDTTSKARPMRFPAVPHGRYVIMTPAPARLFTVGADEGAQQRLRLAALPETGLARFDRIDPDGELHRAGVRDGDRILTLSGEHPASGRNLNLILFGKTSTEPTRCELLRGGELIELELPGTIWRSENAGGVIDFE